ncbi:MAG: methionine adenosyltransferase [Bacilli bacterium]|nr:methionine adenosyltransferase [Bacilli bacterium]
MKRLFTSESVTEGHPDKLCDLISDSLLDEYLKGDSNSRVAIETVAGKDTIFITGEVTSKSVVDIEKVVRETIKSIGYFGDFDINYETCNIIVNITTQSQDISLGTNDLVGGAGDQGIMFGYACLETEELMPLPIMLAHKLSKRLSEVRKNNIIDGIGPDGKTQVTVLYDDDKVIGIDTILISTQHREDKDVELLKKEIIENVVNFVVDKDLIMDSTKILINPTGRFVIGGPLGDSGLTGRKIIVDTYGGYARHGGGAFSGKDPTKVDRSAAYIARLLAKNVVWNGYAKRCEIQLSYAIGIPEPISIYVETFNTNTISDEEIIQKIRNKFDLTPKGIINYLGLREPIYKSTTNYGHFGKKELSWERKVEF